MKENFATRSSEENICNGTCLEVSCAAKEQTLKVPNKTITSEEGTGKETPEKNIQAYSSRNNSSLGVENKGFDDSETVCQPDKFTATNVHKLSSSTAETNCSPSSENKMNAVSSDPESALPVTSAPKTVGAWLMDPHLYKVSSLNLDSWIIA